MKLLSKLLPVALIVAACALSVFGQPEPAKGRQYRTTDKIDVYAAPDMDAKVISHIPASIIFDALEETQRYGGYIKLPYKSKTGYVFKAEVERYMAVPASELVCWSNGYKIIGGVYRYFFVIRNDGTLPYADKITLRLLDNSGKITFEKTTDFSDQPIASDGGGPFWIDSLTEAPQFVLEHKAGQSREGQGGSSSAFPSQCQSLQIDATAKRLHLRAQGCRFGYPGLRNNG